MGWSSWLYLDACGRAFRVGARTLMEDPIGINQNLTDENGCPYRFCFGGTEYTAQRA